MFRKNQENNQTSATDSYVVGIDASLTSFGVYCLPTNNSDWYGWSLQSNSKDGDDTSRIMELATDTVSALLSLPLPISIAVFEDYGPINRTSGKITQRAEICGIVKFHLLTWGVPIVMVSPNSLKSFASGNGKASKDAMLTAANKLGYYPDTHDEADAFHAARLGQSILNGDITGASFHRSNPR